LILARQARIPDPRRQAGVEPDHASRRQGNRELSRPEFLASLRTVFPELATTTPTRTVAGAHPGRRHRGGTAGGRRRAVAQWQAACPAGPGRLGGRPRRVTEAGPFLGVGGAGPAPRKHGADDGAISYSAYILQATLVGPQGSASRWLPSSARTPPSRRQPSQAGRRSVLRLVHRRAARRPIRRPRAPKSRNRTVSSRPAGAWPHGSGRPSPDAVC